LDEESKEAVKPKKKGKADDAKKRAEELHQ